MTAPSARGLALSRRYRRDSPQDCLALNAAAAAPPLREKDDFYPTPWGPTTAFLLREGARMREIGGPVWESAAGNGAMCEEIRDEGFEVVASDLIDRGAGAVLRSYFDFTEPLGGARMALTNPPFKLISAGQSGGAWLRQSLALGLEYHAYLLSWDWPAAVANGLGALLDANPPSRVYLIRKKIDFTGGGAPPQRNAFFVWDRAWQGETALRWLDVPKAPRSADALDAAQGRLAL